MIHAPGTAEGAVARLLAALRAGGAKIVEEEGPLVEDGATRLLWTPVDWMRLGVALAPWRVARGARLVVLSRIGAHPDARAQGLRDLWRLEEYARVSLIPTLTLRFAPLVAAESPFWKKLASRPRFGPEARAVVMPVLEADAITVLSRALAEPRPAEGWFEIAGPEARTLAEWSELASGGSARGDGAAGEWEPPLEELVEHRLCEAEIWQQRFGVRAHAVAEGARAG